MSVIRHETGPRMSQVVIHGNTVYLAGVVARNASGKSMTEQTQVWDAWVSPGNTPARATVEAKLAAPGYNVEIMVVAAR